MEICFMLRISPKSNLEVPQLLIVVTQSVFALPNFILINWQSNSALDYIFVKKKLNLSYRERKECTIGLLIFL